MLCGETLRGSQQKVIIWSWVMKEDTNSFKRWERLRRHRAWQFEAIETTAIVAIYRRYGWSQAEDAWRAWILSLWCLAFGLRSLEECLYIAPEEAWNYAPSETPSGRETRETGGRWQPLSIGPIANMSFGFLYAMLTKSMIRLSLHGAHAKAHTRQADRQTDRHPLKC